jgi:hypothetical protein
MFLIRLPHTWLVQFSSSTERLAKFRWCIAKGRHLFPFRTEQLSLSAPMVLGGQPPGRVGRRRFFIEQTNSEPPAMAALRRSRGEARLRGRVGRARVGLPLNPSAGEVAGCRLQGALGSRVQDAPAPPEPARLVRGPPPTHGDEEPGKGFEAGERIAVPKSCVAAVRPTAPCEAEQSSRSWRRSPRPRTLPRLGACAS